MNAYLVGADVLGNIPDLLKSFGIVIQKHISGRNASHQRKLPALPKETDIIILFTDFIGHNVMRHYRQLAMEQQIEFVACRRSICALQQSLAGMSASGRLAACAQCRARHCAN